LLRRQVAEHCRLLMIRAAHKTILYDYVLAPSPSLLFPQPAKDGLAPCQQQS
jgi:hypothetical protein